MEEGIFGEDDFEGMELEIQKEIEEAIQFAENSPFPAPEEALTGLYAA